MAKSIQYTFEITDIASAASRQLCRERELPFIAESERFLYRFYDKNGTQILPAEVRVTVEEINAEEIPKGDWTDGEGLTGT